MNSYEFETMCWLDDGLDDVTVVITSNTLPEKTGKWSTEYFQPKVHLTYDVNKVDLWDLLSEEQQSDIEDAAFLACGYFRNKKHTDYELNRVITKDESGLFTYENLNIKPIDDNRSALQKEIDEGFRLYGFAMVPFLTVGIMSAGFFLIMLIAVAVKWVVTGTPL